MWRRKRVAHFSSDTQLNAKVLPVPLYLFHTDDLNFWKKKITKN